MLCNFLLAAAILFVLSIILRRQWLSIFTAFFIFALFIVWGLISVIQTPASKNIDNIFEKNSYLKCYNNYKDCVQNFFDIFK